MIRIRWELEEAAALFDFYFRNGSTLSIPLEEIQLLSAMYQNRAKSLGLVTDEKFRNQAGLRLQLACVHYVVTNGLQGMSNANKLFYQTYDLYQKNRVCFEQIVHEFYQKYQ